MQTATTSTGAANTHIAHCTVRCAIRISIRTTSDYIRLCVIVHLIHLHLDVCVVCSCGKGVMCEIMYMYVCMCVCVCVRVGGWVGVRVRVHKKKNAHAYKKPAMKNLLFTYPHFVFCKSKKSASASYRSASSQSEIPGGSLARFKRTFNTRVSYYILYWLSKRRKNRRIPP